MNHERRLHCARQVGSILTALLKSETEGQKKVTVRRDDLVEALNYAESLAWELETEDSDDSIQVEIDGKTINYSRSS